MRLLNLLKRTPSARAAKAAAVPPVSSEESIERIRTRARHRLTGAVVLLGAAVIGFPLLFETQPRPIPVDLPIHIPKKDEVAPLALPGQRAMGLVQPAEQVLTESAEEAGREVDLPEPASPSVPAPRAEVRPSPQPAPLAQAVSPPVAVVPPPAPRPPQALPAPRVEPKLETRQAEKVEPRPEAKVEPKPAKKPEPEPKKPSHDEGRQNEESGRALALLEGRASPQRAAAIPVSDKGRFVLQVGAFSEGRSARDARQKVERLGLQTYTQEVETSEGRRIRVRVGPFASREAAEQAAARVRTAGLPAALLPQ